MIWQEITQMGQTEPAEPTGSREPRGAGSFPSTGGAAAPRCHRLTGRAEEEERESREE